ncbi:bifunctional adenosylcobinamide kinase/adenosylcobinamide-phosphate guanylyltransferase [Aestuariirhabdus litorea]|uniref:Bifunctional adenosylcobalamin biosynthesis protein n=1 Tax=Aestuariirhabdus litorea TaxID=2528527 RepID=A0A3P3VPI8_9GAMM|nr:bifunctional adenosylcobinamide kinase/adenosylcobinamide-phosphate guanylyltransferase [Aestuariirhabdus litorea]RRJ84635.1 bifunctional adenosylcobinamide kinase/adenosylcobinamide-phosphate guanylyltransferase [Aestuariirhabdus litorea]RWW97860.1 bifunctional adenosylcobinamide kinase/adenosylcobinamide-phosphate guanylyltransferase [Endozoicomonadaceae bacterium GTF-13]
MLELVLGGVRSGKSQFAEKRLLQAPAPHAYLATADRAFNAKDSDFAARVEAHRQRRPSDWLLIEEPLHLAAAIQSSSAASLLIDCMGVWLTNLLLHTDGEMLEAELNALLALLERCEQRIIIVSSEVGFGVVPAGELSRRFVDQLGLLNQKLAERAERVWLSVAGIAQQIK